jgi:hypothetical protein
MIILALNSDFTYSYQSATRRHFLLKPFHQAEHHGRKANMLPLLLTIRHPVPLFSIADPREVVRASSLPMAPKPQPAPVARSMPAE